MGADKLWIEVQGRPLIAWTLHAIAASGIFDSAVLVAPPAAWERLRAVAGVAGLADVRCTGGGERRQDSVRAGLDATGEQGIICVHDAARPLCPPQLFAAVVDAAARAGAATAAVPLVDSVKRVDGVQVTESLDRASLVAVQTPQAFASALLREAHQRAHRDGAGADDDAALVERIGHRVVVVPGDPANLKVTTALDVALMRTLVAAPS
jgi:2-C-methyl-D-erythritol 4-phosphate cytidylyltransferase